MTYTDDAPSQLRSDLDNRAVNLTNPAHSFVPPSTRAARPTMPAVKKTARIHPDQASPRKETAIPSSHRQQPSLSGPDEDNYIRSSLPLGRGEQLLSPGSTHSSLPLSTGAVLGPTSKDQDLSKRQEEVVDVEGSSVGVPTIINWTGGGKEVFVCGTFAKNWKERVKMNKRSVGCSARCCSN